MRGVSIKPWRRAGVIFLLATLAGCANPNLQDLKKFVADQKAKTPGRIDPIPEVRQIETFLYEEQGRRDPFTPTEEEMEAKVGKVDNGIRPDFNRRKEELESYSLDELRMVGVVEQQGVTWGLVKTKDGTIHRVKSGNYMGRNHGRIMRITEDKIELTEIVPDGLGGYRERQASIALAEE